MTTWMVALTFSKLIFIILKAVRKCILFVHLSYKYLCKFLFCARNTGKETDYSQWQLQLFFLKTSVTCLSILEAGQMRESKRKREREISERAPSIDCLLYMPGPEIQLCTLTGYLTPNLLLYRKIFQPIEQNRPGKL